MYSPVRRRQLIAPIAQMSTFSLYFSWLSNSGLTYRGDPKLRLKHFLPFSNFAANPKSINFIYNDLGASNIKFSNFKSR